jgi:RNA polymerase sigma factor (sigma-70 family)
LAAARTRSGLHDLELAALSVAGDRSAFGELVRRHGSAVRRLMLRMGADPATADDLAQDAFLAGFEQIAEFRGEGAFRAWISKIAARLFVRRWRREHRAGWTEAVEIEAGEPQAPGPESLMDLDQALKSLNDTERVCISLCYGAGFSHAEAAAALNAPLGTVKSHVKRGLDRLKRSLGDEPEARRNAGG